MKRLIIHFGMHKTGSSSIQATLYHALKGTAFHYVDLGVDNPTGPLLNIFMNAERRFQLVQNAGSRILFDDFLARRESGRARLFEQLANAESDTLIISAEGLNCLSEAELVDFRGLIAPHVGAIDCVAYIRPPKGFMESLFQQQVKGNLAQLNYNALYPGYRERFEAIEHVFGDCNIQYWKFDPKSFSEGCVVRDFCRRMDIPLQADKIIRINEGLSRSAVALLYTYRKYAAGFAKRINVIGENKLLVNKLSELAGPKMRFSVDAIRPVLIKKSDDLRWMEDRLGTSLEEGVGDDAGAIRSESDLFRYDAETLQWLAAQLGPEYADRGRGDLTPEEVAYWVHQLRMKLAVEQTILRRRKQRPHVGEQRDVELYAEMMTFKAKLAHPDMLAKLSDVKANSLVYSAFSRIAHEVNETGEGLVTIAGLGKFRVQPRAQEKDVVEARTQQVVFSHT